MCALGIVAWNRSILGIVTPGAVALGNGALVMEVSWVLDIDIDGYASKRVVALQSLSKNRRGSPSFKYEAIIF